MTTLSELMSLRMSRRNMMLMTGAMAGTLATDYYFTIISTAAKTSQIVAPLKKTY